MSVLIILFKSHCPGHLYSVWCAWRDYDGKSGNLNLGIPGIMYMGGISGLMGAFFYEKDNPNPNALVGVLISLLCAFVVASLGGLIYSVLTITLRVNQNVTGLALTISVPASETFRRFYFQACRRCRTDFRKGYRKRLYSQDSGII